MAASFQIDPLTPADIPAAAAVEQRAYATTAPHPDLAGELENSLAHYFALKSLTPPAELVGLAGYWLIAGEMHVITIAIDPRWKRAGLGQWLLLAMLAHTQTHAAEVATLEVRPSNLPAIALYHKFGFELAGRRPRYYPDTGEDALILTTPPLASPEYQARLDRLKTELAARLAQIQIDKSGGIS